MYQVLAAEVNAQTQWMLADHQGTVRQIANDAGAVINQINYDSFGNITNQTNPSVTFRFGYTGREWDGQTGQYYYRARYFDPRVGQFISQDPIGFSAGDANLYRYVFNSPTNFTDPSGLNARNGGGEVSLNPIDIIVVGIGGIISGGKAIEGAIKDIINGGISSPPLPEPNPTPGPARPVPPPPIPDHTGRPRQDDVPTGIPPFAGTPGLERFRPGATCPAPWLTPSHFPIDGYFPTDPVTGKPLSLPRSSSGVPVPDSPYPHTQIGVRQGRKSDYRQTREWDKDGQLRRDIDWTDHGRPREHTNPHQHDWVPNPTGGSPQHGPPKPFNPTVQN